MAGGKSGGFVEKEQLGPFSPGITSRWRPSWSHLQISDALLAHRRFVNRRPSGAWMIPRLPVNIPRAGVATISPKGEIRFCSGIREAPFLYLGLPACIILQQHSETCA